jgi:Gpi18-like mannosyltransferase
VDELNEKGALRTAFYLLIFPTGFFLGTVFTEGLFVGMAFGSLALARRKKYLWAGLLAAAAALTRAVGVFLVVPLAAAILLEEWPSLRGRAWHKRMLPEAAGILLPLAAMGAWYLSPLAAKFRYVEENYFGQGFLQIGASWQAWKEAFRTMLSWTNPQTSAYYLIEFGCIVLALLSALFILKKYPWVALFSLLALLIPLTSGAPQSLNRYVLACPSIFIFLSHLGKNEIFDRLWTTTSILVMGMLLTLFTYDMWVA